MVRRIRKQESTVQHTENILYVCFLRQGPTILPALSRTDVIP